ncbi:MAG: hypothetical protein PVF91_09100 [Chromatiales bacterium]|jgi:phosphatidylinositol glycan class B
MRSFIAELWSDGTLKRILLVGVAFHALAAWRTYGFYSPDEHFQLLELARFKLGLGGVGGLPWEFHERIRPSLQPTLACGMIGALRELGVANPFTQATVLRFVSGILSLCSLLFVLQAFFQDLPSRRLRRWLLGLGLLLWFVPFLNVRFSSETWSAALMLAAVGLIKRTSGHGLRARTALALGGLLGLGFLFRYQTALMGLGALAWLLLAKKERPAALGTVLGAGAAVLALGLALDRWFYGEWVLTPWNYFRANLIEGKASSFGTSPWWDYFLLVLQGATHPIGAMILLSFLAFWVLYPRSIITWVTLPFFAVHLLIPHKELRFLFPMANLAAIAFVLSIRSLHEKGLLDRLGLPGSRPRAWLTAAFLLVNAPALLAASVLPASFVLNPARYIYEHYGHSQAILLYRKGDPYPYGLGGEEPRLLFYKPETITEQPIESTAEIERHLSDHSRVLFFTLRKETSPPPRLRVQGARCPVVMRTPQWVLDNLNVGGWVEELGYPVLYECFGSAAPDRPRSREEPSERVPDSRT